VGEEESRCYYPEVPCASDRDCVEAPGGVCRKVIMYARCEYYSCRVDADCEGTNRCGCHACVPSSCTEASCDPGQTCRLEYGCYSSVAGYHCSTPHDECASSGDCIGAPCEYVVDHFECRKKRCPILP